MELHLAPQLRPADSRLDAYLNRLALTPEERAALEQQASSLQELHHALAGKSQHAQTAYASVPARLRLAYRQAEQEPLRFAPPLRRKSMVPRPWGNLNPLLRWLDAANRRIDEPDAIDAEVPLETNGPASQGRWLHNGKPRRFLLCLLMLTQTALATWLMREVLPYHGAKPLEMVTLGLFAVLFFWVSSGFWTAVAGFLTLMRGNDPYLVTRRAAKDSNIAPGARTAVVMPICNEDVGRVFAGLRATYESLARSGNLEHFDFFVLSDSNQADTCVAELQAWQSLCSTLDAQGRIYYRHRRRRIKRKSGNIDDFCRRWGANYRYMVVLDADSVMTGTCLSTLVRMMEACPEAGIIQTAPRASGRDSFYARMQQFSTRVYGPLFTAGLHFWQLGEAHYWGHNAIIRVAPFMRHCALSPVPGDGPLVGEILSHDFVEAALMRRAGWAVWIAYDLDGSYEETPPNLLDELARDKRWCQGNLMNFRLMLARGFHVMHRAVFATGVMAYLSSPIWMLFLLLSTAMLASHTLIEPEYFPKPGQLFPSWPEWHPEKALLLFTGTATLLFLPKLLSVLLILRDGARAFGGRLRLLLGMLLELGCSMLLAPVRMLFHTHFVSSALLGTTIKWKSPPRTDNQTGWGEALHRHGFGTVLGIAWSVAIYKMSPTYFWWWLPITGALALSIPVSVLSSRTAYGIRLRRLGLFVIPEELAPPRELQDTRSYTQNTPVLPGFVEAVVDPTCNALLCAHGKTHWRLLPRSRTQGDALIARARRDGPDALSAAEKLHLLDDALLLARLHLEVWSAKHPHPDWDIPPLTHTTA